MVGHFWLPGQGDQAKAGVLAYTPESGSVLTVIGGLAPSVGPLPVVHGLANNTPITLLDCRNEGGLVQGFVVTKQRISAERALVGINLDNDDTQAFVSVEVQVENLTEWGGQSPVRYGDSEPGESWRWQVFVEGVEPAKAQLEGITAELHSRFSPPGDYDRRRGRVNIGANAFSFIRFESKEPRKLDDWLDCVDLVQDLVSLAMDDPCAVLEQTLITSEAVRNATRGTRSEVAVYNRQLVHGQPDKPAVEAREALFTLHDVELGAVLPTWANIRQRVAMACHMLLGLKYISEGYAETKLLTAVGAAEVMHDNLDRPAPLPEDEFAELKEKLLQVVPESRKKWLEGKLYNQPTLKERLIDLASIPDPDIMNRLLPNPKKWAKNAALARNGIAHRGRHNTTEYIPVVQVTTAVLIVNLLQLLGVPKDRVLRALEQNATLRDAARLAVMYWPKKDSG